jgi:hypothetical protein
MTDVHDDWWAPIMSLFVIPDVSLDGIIAPLGFMFAFPDGVERDSYVVDVISGADTLLLGRVTYEHRAQVWPTFPEIPADRGSKTSQTASTAYKSSSPAQLWKGYWRGTTLRSSQAML